MKGRSMITESSTSWEQDRSRRPALATLPVQPDHRGAIVPGLALPLQLRVQGWGAADPWAWLDARSAYPRPCVAPIYVYPTHALGGRALIDLDAMEIRIVIDTISRHPLLTTFCRRRRHK